MGCIVCQPVYLFVRSFSCACIVAHSMCKYYVFMAAFSYKPLITLFRFCFGIVYSFTDTGQINVVLDVKCADTYIIVELFLSISHTHIHTLPFSFSPGKFRPLTNRQRNAIVNQITYTNIPLWCRF